MNDFAIYLFIFSVGAFVVPPISRSIRIPPIVGEILYGMLLRFLIGGNPDLELVDFLSQMGFLFIMFLAGLELNFDHFNRKTLFYPTVLLAGMFLTAWFIWAATGRIGGPFMLIILTATSVGIVFIGLKSNGMEQSSTGQILIWVTSIGELITILLMIIFQVLSQHEGIMEPDFFIEIGELFLLFIGAYIIIRLILLFFWRFPKSVYSLDAEGDTSELGVRLSFMVMLSMVALTALFNLKLILGAFMAGMMLSFVFRDKKNLEHKMSSIGYGFFIPFFFMRLGWDFDIDRQNFYPIVEAALLVFAGMALSRIAGSFLLWRYFSGEGITRRVRKITAFGILWAAPLTLLVAIAKLGYSSNVIDETLYKGLILAAMLSGVIGPVIFQLLFPKDRDEKKSH